jgi:hypothetical protein
LEEIRSAPQSQWLERTSRLLIPYLQDLIWPEAQRLAAGRFFKPEISVRMTDMSDPIPFAEARSVVFPGLFLYRANLAAFLMSHDLYVHDGNRFPVADPILQRPYAVSPVQRSLPLSTLDWDNPATLALLNALTCYGRDNACNALQSITISSILLFALGHEYGHLASGDVGGREYSYTLEKEEAADAWAEKLLLAAGPNFVNDEDRRDYFLLGPPALFHLMAATAKENAGRAELESRNTAFQRLLPADSRKTYKSILNPHSDNDSVSAVQFQFTDTPEWVAIDGVFYNADVLQNRKLKFPSGLHDVVALARGKLAYAEVGVYGSDEVCRLGFRPFRTGDPSTQELAALAKDSKWADILLAAATPDLKPRSGAVSLPVFEALRYIRLGRFIQPELLPSGATPVESRRINRWAKSGQPLAAWTP